jgi:hypothetical protein
VSHVVQALTKCMIYYCLIEHCIRENISEPSAKEITREIKSYYDLCIFHVVRKN